MGQCRRLGVMLMYGSVQEAGCNSCMGQCRRLGVNVNFINLAREGARL